MSSENLRRLLDGFGLHRHRYIYLIGGGGKTSLMFALAHALAAGGRSVLTTTTTKIRYPRPEDSDRVIIEPDASALLGRLRNEFKDRRHITVAPSVLATDPRKLCGFTPDELDRLDDARAADYVLVEADGAAGRSLKAHHGNEPVLSARADLVIAVVGVDCIGMPMNDEHVHRAGLLRERLGRAPESIVTVDDVAAIVLHPDGYLKRVGGGSEVIVFVSKAGTPETLSTAKRLAESLKEKDGNHRIAGVVIGDVMRG